MCTIAETLIEIETVQCLFKQYQRWYCNWNHFALGLIHTAHSTPDYIVAATNDTQKLLLLLSVLLTLILCAFKFSNGKIDANNNGKKRPNNQSVFDVNRYFETISKLFKQKHNDDFLFHVHRKFNKGQTWRFVRLQRTKCVYTFWFCLTD